jgi:hypothetical protein
VPRCGQRPVHAGRADLELVFAREKVAAGLLGRVQRGGDLAGHQGDVVEVDPAVLVDQDPDHVPAAGPGDADVLEVVTHGGHHRLDHRADPRFDGGEVDPGRGGATDRLGTGATTLRHRVRPFVMIGGKANMPPGRIAPRLMQSVTRWADGRSAAAPNPRHPQLTAGP